MTTIITNIPQIESSVDEGVLPSKDWLKLTLYKQLGHAHALHLPHGGASSENNRMHINQLESNECLCSRKDTHEKFNKNIELAEQAPFAFALNRQFLIEALAGINSDGDYILFYNAGSDRPIVITDQDQDRVAIIMPIDPSSVQHRPLELIRVMEGTLE